MRIRIGLSKADFHFAAGASKCLDFCRRFSPFLRRKSATGGKTKTSGLILPQFLRPNTGFILARQGFSPFSWLISGPYPTHPALRMSRPA